MKESAMESKTAQNVQDTYFNALRKDKSSLIIYLVNGVRVFGRIRSFDKYCVLVENGNQDQLVFKHAISTVVITSGAEKRSAPMELVTANPARTAAPESAAAPAAKGVSVVPSANAPVVSPTPSK
jgi:host factor-I protein